MTLTPAAPLLHDVQLAPPTCVYRARTLTVPQSPQVSHVAAPCDVTSPLTVPTLPQLRSTSAKAGVATASAAPSVSVVTTAPVSSVLVVDLRTMTGLLCRY